MMTGLGGLKRRLRERRGQSPGVDMSNAPSSQAPGNIQPLCFTFILLQRGLQNLTVSLSEVGRLNYCLLINNMFSDPWHTVRANKWCVTAN